MNPLLIIGVLITILTVFILLLIFESVTHSKRLKQIPVRISVTGSRGKTSVTRMAASILRESGKKVLAKTTGTEPVYIYPDGTEHLINRIGQANILEQKRLIKKAVKMGVDCLLTEIMSIHPENHRIESRKLIKPNHTIITNFYPDHTDAAGDEDMVPLYEKDIMDGSNVILPSGDHVADLKKMLKDTNVSIEVVEGVDYREINAKLAGILAKELGCNDEAIKRGVEKNKMDSGELRAWGMRENGNQVAFINCFAANDPFSASQNIRIINEAPDFKNYRRIGLLNLRNDRGDRTLQWLDFLLGEGRDTFDELYFSGMHSKAFIRRLGKGNVIKSKDPREIGNTIISNCTKSSLVYGLVNIGGLGSEMIDFWKTNFKEIDISPFLTHPYKHTNTNWGVRQ